MQSMVELTPHDSAALSRLIRFEGLPIEKRREIFGEIEAPDARKVGEVFLDPAKYDGATPAVQATVNRFREWMDANRRLARQRATRRRAAQARRGATIVTAQH